MADITYKITFFSEWHCGSGLSSGSDLDELVIKDRDKFPFIPGKTLKGLLKEAAMEIIELQGGNPVEKQFITNFFGFFDGEVSERSMVHTKGTAYFTDAMVSPYLKKKANEMTEFFYRDMASTAIAENGIAGKSSLRRIETTIPCELYARIYGVDEQYIPELIQCMQWIKRIGLNRNRGLGRCHLELMEEKEANL